LISPTGAAGPPEQLPQTALNNDPEQPPDEPDQLQKFMDGLEFPDLESIPGLLFQIKIEMLDSILAEDYARLR
jgi:hypothetical protein